MTYKLETDPERIKHLDALCEIVKEELMDAMKRVLVRHAANTNDIPELHDLVAANARVFAEHIGASAAVGDPTPTGKELLNTVLEFMDATARGVYDEVSTSALTELAAAPPASPSAH